MGICDECLDWTLGDHCEKCIVGSYRSASGCFPCNCNGHADKQKGECDSLTGKCYCLDHTEGNNCDLCKDSYYGEPRNGGTCYLKCQSRSILEASVMQGIGSFATSDDTKECMWMLKLNDSIVEGSLIHMEIEENNLNVTCYNNAIYVFNQIPDTPHSLMQKKLIICDDSNYPKIVEESKTGQMTIFFQRGVANEGFNAKIFIYSCQLKSCIDPFICDENNHCVCPHLTTGSKCEIEICPKNCSKSLGQGECDIKNNRCICTENYGGSDCSREIKATSIVVSEIFTTQVITGTLNHLKKTLPRLGHTVNADRRGFLWIFGGFSQANGALNDIRQFDTKNLSWNLVTIDGAEAKMPKGRYFHASEIVKQVIYTFGGLSHDVQLLNDFWMFKIQEQRWLEIRTEHGPGFLAGLSLNLVKINDHETLISIGGYSNETVFIAWEYSFNKSWKKLNISGSGPTTIFGHSAVFHAVSQVIYIFGGYQTINGKVNMSKKLYSLSYQKENQSWRWSTIPGFSELNRPEENLPRARFLHSSVGFSQYMILFGGETQPHNYSDYLNAYIYKCNSWVRLTESVEIIGQLSPSRFKQAQTVVVDSDSEMNQFFIVGGFESSFSISKISIPSDLCQMLSSSKFMCRQFFGCSFGQLSTINNTKKTFCFSSDQKENRKNEIASSFNHGKVCDSKFLAQRNCSSFYTCEDCQSIWPHESEPSCKWSKKCMPNTIQGNETLSAFEPCSNTYCSSNDCETCETKLGCNWTKVEEKFQCLAGEKIQNGLECPKKCSSFDDCNSCLTSSSERGFEECVWSTKMRRCFSNPYKSLMCAGGTCGLLLSRNESYQCPSACESQSMCSQCLQKASCGWCSTDMKNNDFSGDGVCIEGNLNQPSGNDMSICTLKYESSKNISIFSPLKWNFLSCPMENECLNEHHNCNNKTEKCIDLQHGFKCECGDGYEESEDTDDCLPICVHGCVHGTCVEPGSCKCDFGYVGNNCSIQCSCYGNSDCAGPDRLDECLQCMNNTIGKQCEKCKIFFVGDPRSNEKCRSCLEYCNGHADLCISESETSHTLKNLTKAQLDLILIEGARKSAVCLNCGNFTSGQKCETCIDGFFRGTSNLNEVCRKCECNGHGDTCDSVTGEKCNCGNNTESDSTCPAKLDNNATYRCWLTQCAKCKDSFSGHPKNGHQCYKHITIDSKMCLENAKSLDECKVETVPLKGGKTVFFVIQPRFMNVDIRIILDVTVGELDFFMTTNDDSFVVLTNQSNSFHEILLDSKYQWVGLYSENSDYSENLNITPLVTSSKNSFENVSIPHGFTDDRGAHDCRSHGKFYVLDKNAQSQTTFVKLTQCNTLLRVFELKNRLVVTLPQNVHNLSGTRFFIALRAANHATATGLLFFR